MRTAALIETRFQRLVWSQHPSIMPPQLAERGHRWHIRPMNSSVALYEALTSAPDERTRARLIAEAFERLDERYPHLPDLVTQGHLRESELRLKREIEQLRGDVFKEIEQLRGDIARAKIDLLKWLVPILVGQVIAIAGLVKLL
jgi:hypothetical protein